MATQCPRRSDKHLSPRKNQASGGYAFEVCLYCFSQIKETGAFVVRGWRNVKKEAAILCHYILFHTGFPLKRRRTVFTGKDTAPLPAGLVLQ